MDNLINYFLVYPLIILVSIGLISIIGFSIFGVIIRWKDYSSSVLSVLVNIILTIASVWWCALLVYTIYLIASEVF